MDFYRRLVIFLVIGLGSIYFLKAQPGSGRGQGMSEARIGSLKGVVVDQQTGAPVPFANIVLYRLKDSTIVDGTISSEEGVFNISALPFGAFYLQIQYVGYPAYTIDSIFIRPNDAQLDMGSIALEFSSVDLDEFVVSGERAPLQFNLDRRVINIESDIAASSSTAAEVMQNIPSVTVDVDGNVSLRGSSNVIILIDGRPSMLNNLDEMPADMIESIELITNPSARYDPDGTSGMINIVLKKERDPGYNGMVSMTYGTKAKAFGTLNFNYRENKVNFFINANTRIWEMQGYSNFERITTLSDARQSLRQKQDFERNGHFNNLRLGGDYFINDRNTLSVMLMGNLRQFLGEEHNKYSTYSILNGIEEPVDYFTQFSDSRIGGDGYEGAINYRRTYDDRIKELTADLFYSSSEWRSNRDMNRSFFYPDQTPREMHDYLQLTRSNTQRHNITGQIDYVTPVGNGGRLETGYKLSLNENHMDYMMMSFDTISNGWLHDEFAANEFIYNEQLHSAYVIYSNSINEKLKYQGGIRAEQVFTEGEQLTQDTTFERSYFNLFPSIHLRYEPSQRHNYLLSYSRRVNRPGSRVLNPFVDYSDPFNLSRGNPYLDPEFVNSFEAGYSFYHNKSVINTNLFYRYTDGIVTRVMLIEDDGITAMTTFENINKEESYGLELIVSHNLTEWWSINANYSHFRTRLYGEDISSQADDNYSWTFRVNSTMRFQNQLDVQVNFNYRSPQIFTGGMSNYRYFQSAGGLGIRSENYFVDMSLRKGVLDNKGQITLRLRDVFNTIKFDVHTYGDNFESSVERRRESRVLFVGFSYRINEYRPRRDRRPSLEEEIDMD